MIYVLFHGNCADGFGAAFAFWDHGHVFSNGSVRYIPVFYGQPPPNMPDVDEVYILDFSYKRPILEEIRKRVPKLTVIDHHASAQKELEGLDYALFDLSHSGAVLAWKFFHTMVLPDHPVTIPTFLQYIEDRDLWKWELPKSREFSAALRSYPYDFEVWKGLSFNVHHLLEEGHGIMRSVRHMAELEAADPFWYMVDGHEVPVVNASSALTSEICEVLLERYADAPFVLSYFDRADAKRVWSIRGRGEVDCSQIASKRGGGGHHNAAGFLQPVGRLEV